MALEKQHLTVEQFEAFIERPENAARRFELSVTAIFDRAH